MTHTLKINKQNIFLKNIQPKKRKTNTVGKKKEKNA